MKKALALMAIVLTLGLGASLDAEAKRLGGGKSSGMQRNTTSQPAQQGTSTPGTPAQGAPAAGTAAAAAPAAAAAAAPKRSWMGPIAGIAAGLGIAALASHFGFGEALANMLTIALVVMAVLALVAFVMRKRAQGQGAAMAGAGAPGGFGSTPPAGMAQRESVAPRSGSLIGSGIGSGLGGAAAVAAAGNIPAGFDVAAFSRNAKEQFLALQAANDAGDYDRLREYLTPEMLEVVREEVAERGGATQKTEVFGLQADVLGVAEEADRYVVSVRFTGSIREQHGVEPQDLAEVWHLTKPRFGAGGWQVAGIQQA